MESICILGITGSIGTQVVSIAKKLGFKIVGCSFNNNVSLGTKLVKENKIKYSLCCSDTKKGNCSTFNQLIKKAKPDLVVNAIIGFAGLEGTLAAINNKCDIALANKESIVVAGWYIFKMAKKYNLKVIPIDSEHTNLCLQLLHCKNGDVNQIYITCSGGKYFNFSKEKLKKITYEQATTHKNWKMGSKITIDSNTLINKCFEVVEAYHYFGTNKISVLHDPTSIIHSAIMLDNGQFSFSESKPLMTGPIAWALTNFNYKLPKTIQAKHSTDVLVKMDNIKPISWAYDIINDKTNSLAVIINAADEVAIHMFREKTLRFDQVVQYIENTVKHIKLRPIKTMDDLYKFDRYVRLASIKYWK